MKRLLVWVLPALLSTSTLAAEDDSERSAFKALWQQRATLSSPQLERALEQFADYPLVSYLEYQKLKAAPGQQLKAVQRFLAREPDSYLSHQLRYDALQALAKQERWQDYLELYQLALNSTALRCHALQARVALGEVAALDQVASLWNVGRSQDSACDALFARWIEAGKLNDTLAWSRYRKAVNANNLGLARYVRGLMSKDNQDLAQLYFKTYRQPESLRNTDRYRAQTPWMQDIIATGLQRLSRRDGPLAFTLWQRYRAQQLFNDNLDFTIAEVLYGNLVRQNNKTLADKLLAQHRQLANDSGLGEWQLRRALKEQDWGEVGRQISLLPEALRNSSRWRYWQARSFEALGQDEPAQALWQQLAAERSFYGFMAADRLQVAYNFADRPLITTEPTLHETSQLACIQRMRELFELNELYYARKEWRFCRANMNQEQQVAVARLGQLWGWHRVGIQTMIDLRYWDDLKMRFPLAYAAPIKQASESRELPTTYLYAIARQESAFREDARSPAGARGLMQLMPGTAKQTARKLGKPYSQTALLEAETNIDLGSSYLQELLARFDNNRVLASAAYNAGPYRVKRWLSEADSKLPVDIWIETIPFKETRHYVQNVLAFSLIYAYRLDQPQALLEPHERQAL